MKDKSIELDWKNRQIFWLARNLVETALYAEGLEGVGYGASTEEVEEQVKKAGLATQSVN